MAFRQRREKLRAILNGNTCVRPGSVYDATSIRIAQDLGFPLGMFGGSVASLAVLGDPDITLITLTELCEQMRRMSRAAELPVLVDADHGYGNALNVMRTVQELENAGVAAMSIEDTDLPRPFGAPKPRLVPLEEGVGKVQAALAARTDPATVVFARTGAASITGMEDALARTRAYSLTGADGLFLTGVTTRDQLDALAAVATIPLVLGTLSDELADRAYLAARGVRIALQGHQPFQASVQALYATLKALREGTPPKALQNLAPPALMKRLSREAEYEAATRDFLG